MIINIRIIGEYALKHGSRIQEQMLQNRSQSQGREEGEGPMVPWAGGEIFLDAMLPAIIITEIMVPKRASSIAKPPSRE